jgi:multidrug efflux pump subunit AcrB
VNKLRVQFQILSVEAELIASVAGHELRRANANNGVIHMRKIILTAAAVLVAMPALASELTVGERLGKKPRGGEGDAVREWATTSARAKWRTA